MKGYNKWAAVIDKALEIAYFLTEYCSFTYPTLHLR